MTRTNIKGTSFHVRHTKYAKESIDQILKANPDLREELYQAEIAINKILSVDANNVGNESKDQKRSAERLVSKPVDGKAFVAWYLTEINFRGENEVIIVDYALIDLFKFGYANL